MAKVELLFIPTPGIGHLISTVELAKRLIEQPDRSLSATILTMRQPNPTWATTTSAYISSVISSGLPISFHELPPIDPPRLPNMSIELFLALYVDAYRPILKAAISQLLASSPTPIAAVVLDIFCASMIDIAGKLSLPAYIYFTSSAGALILFLYALTLHEKIPCEMKDFDGYVDIPGLPLAPPLSMPDTMMDKKKEGYMGMVSHGQLLREANGILVNTFAELETEPLKALANGWCLPDHPTPPVYPVGPLLALGPKEAGPKQHECVEWLDGQPAASVVLLCFGSMGSFGKAQVKEMAAGLERSGHRFLWVLRSPSVEGFLPEDSKPEEVLPEGFLERTEGRGMVWPSWAPQLEILAHGAVGGFVTHCGWNSCLESLWFGVPMIAWPLYAEQHLNAFEMAKALGVALELKLDRGNGGFVKAEELERGVRCLMGCSEEGKKVSERAQEMKVASRKAVQEGGSSYVALESFMQKVIEEMPTDLSE